MPWKLYYDAGCNLCHSGKLKAERWAKASGQPLEPVPIQSDEGRSKGYDLHEMALEADGKTYRGANAWLKLMEIAPPHLRWISWLKFPPFSWLAKAGYWVVARVRYRVFGRRACEVASLRLPNR